MALVCAVDGPLVQSIYSVIVMDLVAAARQVSMLSSTVNGWMAIDLIGKLWWCWDNWVVFEIAIEGNEPPHVRVSEIVALRCL